MRHNAKLRKLLAEMGKIPVTFHKYDGRPSGIYAAMYMTELGVVVRSFAPLQVKGWKQITEMQKKPMFDRLQSAFVVDFGEGPGSIKKENEQLMKECYRNNRSRMHEHYQKHCDKKPWEERLKTLPKGYCDDQSDWEFMCKMFESEEFTAQPQIFPRIFGHEASGIVESVGEGVSEFEVGDHVLSLFTGECKRCRACASGKGNICNVLGLEREGVMHSDKKTRFSIKGKPVYHYCAVSSFSEYTVVHSGCAVKISSTAPMEKICLLSCGVAAGLGAAWKVANISHGSTVVIFGLGTVGLSVAQGAKLRGASTIIGIDTNSDKSEKAKAFGVTEFLNPNDHDQPIQQVINGITDGGADYAFECVGDTGTVNTALQSCCSGWGLTVTLGVPKEKPQISAHYGLFLSGRTLTGSLFGGWKPKSDLPSLVDMYLRKEIEIDNYITHNLMFQDINKAFELMTQGKCLRCVIHMPK